MYAILSLYYGAINVTNEVGNSTPFLGFMRSVIQASPINAIKTSDDAVNKVTLHRRKSEVFLQTHEYIINTDVPVLCEVSAATANRVLLELVQDGVFTKFSVDGHWTYKGIKQSDGLSHVRGNDI